mgnify:CR=1 FL=1
MMMIIIIIVIILKTIVKKRGRRTSMKKQKKERKERKKERKITDQFCFCFRLSIFSLSPPPPPPPDLRCGIVALESDGVVVKGHQAVHAAAVGALHDLRQRAFSSFWQHRIPIFKRATLQRRRREQPPASWRHQVRLVSK